VTHAAFNSTASLSDLYKKHFDAHPVVLVTAKSTFVSWAYLSSVGHFM